MYKKFLKRFFDISLSALALVVLSPLMLALAILVKVFIGSPIIFKQERTSRQDKLFYIYKFKTMRDLRVDGVLLSDEERRCKFGDLLRSTSLDELPELWNILVGDMSIIGPRPLYASYLEYYTEEEKERNKVRGGLVPPEVLNKNPTPTWDEQLKTEAEYANNVTFLTDLKIFFATFVILYKRMRYDYGEYDRQALNVERAKKLVENAAKETAEV